MKSARRDANTARWL